MPKERAPRPIHPLPDETSTPSANPHLAHQANKEHSKLLKLPDELLLRIAGYLYQWLEQDPDTDDSNANNVDTNDEDDGMYDEDGWVDEFDIEVSITRYHPVRKDHVMHVRSRNLTNFTRTCKRLVPIGRETLVRERSTSYAGLHSFLQFLLRYPIYLQKVTKLQIRYKEYQRRIEPIPTKERSLTARLMATRFACDSIRDTIESNELFHQLHDVISKTITTIPVLLALCPNLHELQMERCAHTMESLMFEHSTESLPNELQLRLLDQITELCITDYMGWLHGHHGYRLPLILRPMKNLQLLSIPYGDFCDLRYHRSEWLYPVGNRFPNLQSRFPNLQSLTIFWHEEYYGSSLQICKELCTALDGLGHLASLNSVKLCFLHTHELLDLIGDPGKTGHDNEAFLTKWSDLENLGIQVQAFFIRDETYNPVRLENYKFIDLRYRLQTFWDKYNLLRALPENQEADFGVLFHNTVRLMREDDAEWFEKPRGAELQWQAAQNTSHESI